MSNKYQKQLQEILQEAQRLGQNGDTILAHINEQEAQLLKELGGSGTVNPQTGLLEFQPGIEGRDTDAGENSVDVSDSSDDDDDDDDDGFWSQVYDFITTGEPIDLGGDGVQGTGESQTSESSGSSVSQTQVQSATEAVTEAEDPYQAFEDWYEEEFGGDNVILSPQTEAQLHLLSTTLLGRPNYGGIDLNTAKSMGFRQIPGDMLADDHADVYIHTDGTVLMVGEDGMMYTAERDGDGSFTMGDEQYVTITGYDESGLAYTQYNNAEGVQNFVMDTFFGEVDPETGERTGDGLVSTLQSGADGTTYVRTGDNVNDPNLGYTQNTVTNDDGTTTTTWQDSEGNEVQVDGEGNVLQQTTVYDVVEDVVNDALAPGGPLALAAQDVDAMRGAASDIRDIGNRFGAYVPNGDGTFSFNPNSFEARYGAYEQRLSGPGGIADDYQSVIERLQPYEGRALDLAEDYQSLGQDYQELYADSRDPNAYREWQDLLFADAKDQVNRNAVGARDTLNSQYANAGMDPNSPAYTAALMALEQNRSQQLSAARRQSAVDSFSMGNQALQTSANMLGGVSNSLAGVGQAYGMGINTLLNEGNLISNKANAILQGVGLLNSQAGAAAQQASLLGQSAGISQAASQQGLNVNNAAIGTAQAGVGNVNSWLNNQTTAYQPYLSMSPLIWNMGNSALQTINTSLDTNAQTRGEVDITNKTINATTED